MAAPARPHLPAPAPIEAYGNGGFRFAGMSHRGSLLCLPDGVWGWPVAAIDGVTETALADVIARAGALDIFLLGSGRDLWTPPLALRQQFQAARISFDAMTTAAAVRTYNVLLAEGRRAGAGLIAVG